MKILFIKQGVTSYGPIEASIERAGGSMADINFATADLTKLYFSQPKELVEKGKLVRMPKAISDLMELIKQYECDLVFLLNGFIMDHYVPAFFDELRASGKKIITWQIDDPYYIDKTLPFVKKLDIILTVDSSAIPAYKAAGKDATFLPLACDPVLHKSYTDVTPDHCPDICFIGVPFAGSRRVQLINELVPTLKHYHTKIMGTADIDNWQKNLPDFEQAGDIIQDIRVQPADTVRYFSGAKINLNIHKDSYGHEWDKNSQKIEAQSPCERTFCIAGCGGFQLIDDTRTDLDGLFEVGKELITFSDANDLAEKMDYFLKREDERTEIARAGQLHAHGNHTYQHRVSEILSLI